MKKSRHLVTALCAAVALTATLGVSSASAADFTFDSYPATVKGSIVNNPVIIDGGAVEITCEGNNFSGSVGAASETLTPGSVNNANCLKHILGSTEPVTMKMNGCKFIFHAGPETAPMAGTFDIGSAGCGPLKLEEKNCTKLIGAQSGFSATYENVGSGSTAAVRIQAQGTGISYTVEKSSASCKAGTLTYRATWQVTATNAASEATGAHLSSDVVDMNVASKAFEAAQYPVDVVGEQGPGTGYEGIGQHELTMGAVQLGNCDGVSFDGEATKASSQLTVGASYLNCTGTVLGTPLPVTVSTNSCSYVFHALSGSLPYIPGTMDIVCGKEGDGIETKIYASKTKQEEGKTLCVMKLGAQTGLGEVVYANTSYGGADRIAVYLDLSGLSYTRQGSATCGAASGKTGTYTGESQLVGLK